MIYHAPALNPASSTGCIPSVLIRLASSSDRLLPKKRKPGGRRLSVCLYLLLLSCCLSKAMVGEHACVGRGKSEWRLRPLGQDKPGERARENSMRRRRRRRRGVG